MFDFELQKIKQDVKKHFEFLFDSGFHFYSAKYQKEHMRYWEIILRSKGLLVKIYDDRGEIMMSAISARSKDGSWYGLGTLVYFITKGEYFIGRYEGNLLDKDSQMQRLSEILRKYVDEIYEVMGSGFESNRGQLQITHQQVLDLYQEAYRKSRPESDFLKYVPKRKNT
jgi:hypothetical protein